MKIKTMEFLATNLYGNRVMTVDSTGRDNYIDGKWVGPNTVTEPEDCDAIVNAFCEDKEVIDIKVQVYKAEHHNNGFGEWNIVRYTIIYK